MLINATKQCYFHSKMVYFEITICHEKYVKMKRTTRTYPNLNTYNLGKIFSFFFDKSGVCLFRMFTRQ